VRPESRYESVTSDIRIRVEPEYADDQSEPDEGHYVWRYTVHISNEGESSVRLQSRVWQITDALGRTQEVRGAGVIGQTPVIEPGQSFSYASGCPLNTPSGIMVGSYAMEDADGKMFEVEIPAFSLDSPYTVRTVN